MQGVWPLEPDLGRKFHVESEFDVKNAQLQHPEAENEDKGNQKNCVSMCLFSVCYICLMRSWGSYFFPSKKNLVKNPVEKLGKHQDKTPKKCPDPGTETWHVLSYVSTVVLQKKNKKIEY